MKKTLHDFEVTLSDGSTMDFAELKGKVTIIVNTATQCGLVPQFEGLEDLYEKYKDKGLQIIGFPCNQFMSQEPVENHLMAETCKLNYGVTFPLTQKTEVNGKNTHPVFKYLKKEKPGFLLSAIKWNFTKFLIGPDGKPYKRYSPHTEPEKMEKDILKLLEKAKP